MATAFRCGDISMVFDGQSIPVWPSKDHINSWPMKLIQRMNRRVVHHTPAVGGYSWDQLDNDFDFRVARYAKMADISLYVMCGGTTQVSFGQNGYAVYQSEKNIATLARNAGFDYVISSTTTPSSSFYTGAPAGTLAQRQASFALTNSSKIADDLNAFDALSLFAEDSRLAPLGVSPWVSSTYYEDGTHPTRFANGGTTVMADLMWNTIETFLATL